jgi:16S rRNA (cytosine967-C5)-methyltransferase
MVRQLAWEILQKVFRQEVYSNIALSQTLRNSVLSEPDQRLLTQLVYGVIHRQKQLDYYLKPMIQGKKVSNAVRYLLLLSLYQLKFMDKIPDYAVLNESVELAKSLRPPQDKFVNAVLRNVKEPVEPMTELEQFSVSEWLYKQLKGQYPNEYRQILASYLEEPKRSGRLNVMKATMAQAVQAGFEPSLLSPVGILLPQGNLAAHSWYSTGKVSIQDEASQRVALAMNPQPGERILDMCAAPGGKATHIAELMNNTGEVIANDIYPHKAELIQQNVKRLGLTNVTITTEDAALLGDRYEANSFDRVLLDAPCTGWGVISRKPEIKYFTSREKQDALIQIQISLLDVASTLVKTGGILVYSTCTLNKGENEVQVKTFMARHPEFTLLTESLLLPHTYQTDGFYIATLRKGTS